MGVNRKAFVVLAALLVLALTFIGGADARTLRISKAKAAAQRFLAQDARDYPYDPPKKLTGCKRKSARVVDCDYKAVSTTSGTATCGSVRVRYKNRKTSHATVAFRGSDAMCAP